MALMGDPGASPVRGRPVRLDGKAIGRVSPGFIAGEDVIFQDRTGLMAVDFRSMLGLIGNLFAGWKRVPKHMDQDGEATGWFRRSHGRLSDPARAQDHGRRRCGPSRSSGKWCCA